MKEFVQTVIDPASLFSALVVFGLLARYALGRGNLAWRLLVAAVLWGWLWSAGPVLRLLWGDPAREFKAMRVEEYPDVDAIVELGGGTGYWTNYFPYVEFLPASGRVAHAARLWKGERAPMIIASGVGPADSELLSEYGVPRERIVVEGRARNTAENALYVGEELRMKGIPNPTVLLVTSVWHMKRSLLMFELYAPHVRCIPAPVDYQGCGGLTFDYWLRLRSWMPSAAHWDWNVKMWHEFVGYWWYKITRPRI